MSAGAAQLDAFGVYYSEVVTNLMSGSALSGVIGTVTCPSLIPDTAATLGSWISSTRVGEASASLSTVHTVFARIVAAWRFRWRVASASVTTRPSRFLVLAVHVAPYAATATSCEARG